MYQRNDFLRVPLTWLMLVTALYSFFGLFIRGILKVFESPITALFSPMASFLFNGWLIGIAVVVALAAAWMLKKIDGNYR